MAKQTFTTGQVLTAAQMTSLQQTALGGGATTAKTASYVLVAADAGTVVQMNAAGATTITVNTALFSAGDTVQIQNVGAGVCTVTAGTATVSTSATLALKQYDAGSLYFNTTSAAIFFAVDAADGMTNPMTTTGDIIYSSSGSTPARLGIGTTGQVLNVASGLPSWATPTSGSLTLLSTTTLTGASTTISSISGAYKNLQIEAVSVTNSTADGRFKITPNASTTISDAAGLQLVNTISISFWDMQNFIGSTQTIQARANADNATLLNIYNYSSTSDYKNFNYTSGFLDTGGVQRANSMASGTIKTASAITSIKFENTGGNFAGGTVRIYGVN